MVVDLEHKVYLGIVEDNNDPDRENKCRIRVISLFDDIPLEDIPWATPWKDTNGIACNLPENNKIVSVEFENGDIYHPVYRYAEHNNINLENKLKELSEEDYLSMIALIFDHRTQIFSNESEGLKLDHKYNLLNITENTIDLNLKSNKGRINIGTRKATQQAILGNNFLDWFDTFVSHLLGETGGPYYGNLMAPIVASPTLIEHLQKYRALKDPDFLSHNVNFNDNGSIEKLERPSLDTNGDNWTSTVEDRTSDNIPKEVNYDITYKTHGESTSSTNSNPTDTEDPADDDSTNSNSPTPNADKLRNTLASLGYSEKGYAISSGGDITKEMELYASNVFSKIKELYPSIGIRVTSGNDKFHQRLNYNSRHKKGNAIDFVINPANRQDIKNVEKVVKGFVALGNRRARYLNEYNDPTKAATGYHFHLSWGLGTEANDEINQAIADANAGLINTYRIA